MPEGFAQRVWESSSITARIAREALRPASWAYAGVVAMRNLAYDHEWLRSAELALPAISIGNLSVGGTGKTPVAAYVAARLAAQGLKPAIVMRGYGSDESLVHARLNPGIPVIVAADRVRGALEARGAGRDVVVLDDAFQHRHARRDADIVLLSADLAGPVRSLPAGPWREPLTSLARASLIAVTRKSASPVRARELLLHARRFAPAAGGAVIHLAADCLVNWTSGEEAALSSVGGRRVLAAAGIGDPRAFASQLADAGAQLELAAERDHHAYSAADAAALARRAEKNGMLVCTLKDAVKLGPVWPRAAPPLWYLSQRVVVESGASDLDGILATISALKPAC
ncbi:MAG: tetraacyldisaccharide 4'-kinase [Gemmatimonadaceae bacterium]